VLASLTIQLRTFFSIKGFVFPVLSISELTEKAIIFEYWNYSVQVYVLRTPARKFSTR